MKKLVSLLLVLVLAAGCVIGAATAEGKKQTTEIKPDLTMKVGKDADCELPAGKAYVIRLKGAKGETVIEADAAFALKMEITDETDGQTTVLKGKKGELFQKSFKAKSSRTYLISITANNGKSSGKFHIRIYKKPAEEKKAPAPEEVQVMDEDQAEGPITPNDEPGMDRYVTRIDTPTITKISQTNTKVKIQWTEVDEAEKYLIYVYEDGYWEKIGTVYGYYNTTFTHTTRVTRSTSGYTVKYRVCAVDYDGEKSDYSTKSLYRLASPGTVKIKKHSSKEDTAVVTWSKVKGAKKYYVYYRSANSSKYKLKKVSADKTKTTIPVVGTKKNEVYVIAYGNGSKSTKTAIKSIKPYWYRVLLVGNYEYYDGNNDLPGCKFDVTGMAKLFGKQTDRIKKLYNASSSTILNGIINTFDDASENTICVFMYSGHGYTDYGDFSGALACSDGSWITTSTLKYYLDSYTGGSKHIVLLLGSCGSGGLIDPNGEPEEQGSAQAFNDAVINTFKAPSANAGEFATSRYTVITAAAAHQVGWCSWWWNSYGEMVNGGTDIMRALGRAGGYDYCDSDGNNNGTTYKHGDTNGDDKVSVYEAYRYAWSEVVYSDVQFWSTENGLILFQ